MSARNAENERDGYKIVPIELGTDHIFRNICPSVSAVYHLPELELDENANNPLILALPPLAPMKSIVDGMAMAFAVPHAQSYRTWSPERQLLGIDRISKVLVLTAAHVKMLSWLYIALRHRYQSLVPTRTLKKLVQKNYALTQSGTPQPVCPPGDSHADCMLVFGISGTGKTTLVKMVLSTLPMIIEHRRFRGISAKFVQVVWVLVSCPPNGSVLTLMKGILHWFDHHLGTYYVMEVKSRSNTADYILKVDEVLRRHMVGVLVIDEIQFALNSAEKAQLMGFLTNLLNSNHCTFILLGTPDARRYLVKSLRNARRVVSGGFIALHSLPDDEWARMAKATISIDFLPLPPSKPDEISQVLREVSASFPAFVKLAWRLTQYIGLHARVERVTPALIRSAVKDGFGPVEGLLEALRKGNYAALAECVDLATAQVEAFREKIERERQRRQLGTVQINDDYISTFVTSVAMLIEMGRTETEAESVARRILEADRTLSSEEVIRQALSATVPSSMDPVVVTKRAQAKPVQARSGRATHSEQSTKRSRP
jgi:hypothetical protein